MPKQVFLARSELVVARCGPPKIPKCLENGLFWNKKCVKFGSKMCSPKNEPFLPLPKSQNALKMGCFATKKGQKWVKKCFSKNDPRPLGVPKQMK